MTEHQRPLIEVSTGGMINFIILDKDFDVDKLVNLIKTLDKECQDRLNVCRYD